jgi:hypothetical protein
MGSFAHAGALIELCAKSITSPDTKIETKIGRQTLRLRHPMPLKNDVIFEFITKSAHNFYRFICDEI